MNNQITFEELKKDAYKRYKEIGQILCPILGNEYVHFNSIGFKHLIRKQVKRSQEEQLFRFSLLPYVAYIIGDPRAKIYFREKVANIFVKRHGKKVLHQSLIKYWGLESIRNNMNIKVVIRQVDSGSKHFYSIMTEPSKNPA